MTHDLTWSGRAHASRRARRARARSHTRAVTIGCLLLCALLASFATAAAYAAPYDMRGEWSLEFKSQGEPAVMSSGVIKQENLTTGLFTATFEGNTPGGELASAIEGTASESTTSISSSTNAPFGTITFVANSVAINTASHTLSGNGTYYLNGKEVEPGTVVGTRLKSYQEVIEQEERERREHEEARLREEVRGEWSITVGSGPQAYKGIALISESADSKNEFSASSATFESVIPGSFSGTLSLEASKSKVHITTQAAGPAPATDFTSEAITVELKGTSMTMSGSGELTAEGGKITTTMSATRLRSHGQIVEEEEIAREAQEKERLEREAREKAEREATEKAEREAREKRVREEAEKLVPKILPSIIPPSPPAVLSSATLAGKVTISHSGALGLELANPNTVAVHGHLKVTYTQAGKGASVHSAASKTTVLGETSFTIAASGKATLKLKLSKSGRALLARHKTLRVTLTLTTQASGRPEASKTYSVALHASGSSHHGKG